MYSSILSESDFEAEDVAKSHIDLELVSSGSLTLMC